MRIDDLSALIQAHKLIRGRNCPEFLPSNIGISCAYFDALQDARRVHSENVGGYVPLFAKRKYGLSQTYFLADSTPVYFYDLKTRKPGTALPPASCYRIHLTTEDKEGEAI